MTDSHTICTLNGERVLLWVVDNDSILCQHGTPLALDLPINSTLKPLPLIMPAEIHNAPHTINNSSITTNHQYFVISKDDLVAQNPPTYITEAITQGEFISYRRLVSALSVDMAQSLARCVALVRWHSTTRYCSACATPLPINSTKTCPQCHHISYPLVQPCVIVAITRINPVNHHKQLLLARHHRHANSGMYGLIAGYAESGENLEAAVVREVFEETGLSITDIRYMGSQPWPYPANLMVGFTATYHGGTLRLQADELDDARFFDFDALPHIPPMGTIARTMIDKICRGRV